MSIISVPILVRGRHVMDSQYMPAEELPRRRAAMGELLVRRGLDGVICYADSSCNGYVEYFTNYNCATPFTNALFLLTADGRSVLIASVPPRDTQRMRNGFIPDDVELLTVGMSPLANDHVGRKAVEFLAENGLTGKRWGGVNLARCMKKTLDDLECALPPIDDLTAEFEALRAVKSAAEIEIIRRAASLARKAALTLAGACREGAEECAAAAQADRLARCAGAEDIQIFIGTSESGRYLRLPQMRRLQNGEIVKILCQVQYLRYRGLFATTALVGADGPQPEALAEEFGCALRRIVPGAAYSGAEPGAEAAGHSAIHGLGLDLAEAPCAAFPLAEYEENMVLGVLLESDGAIMADTGVCTGAGGLSLSGTAAAQ